MPHEVRIEIRSTEKPSVTVVAPTALTPPAAEVEPDAKQTWAARIGGLLGGIGLGLLFATPWKVALIGAALTVSFLGHFVVAFASRLALWITGTDQRLRADFGQVAAFVGLVERPLMLGALAAGQPGFIAVWLGYKAIGKWKDWSEGGAAGRNIFVMHLLHTSLSLLVVGLVWLGWLLLGLPPLPKPAS